ncbi:MAG: hypothetical protein ACFCVE_06845 [Phycisphaerae bacterium]
MSSRIVRPCGRGLIRPGRPASVRSPAADGRRGFRLSAAACVSFRGGGIDHSFTLRLSEVAEPKLRPSPQPFEVRIGTPKDERDNSL